MLDPSRDYTEADLAALEAEELARLASFELGDPVLVCRWRIAGRQLPLESRHLRALRARSAQGDSGVLRVGPATHRADLGFWGCREPRRRPHDRPRRPGACRHGARAL